jgi:hypothetical protein
MMWFGPKVQRLYQGAAIFDDKAACHTVARLARSRGVPARTIVIKANKVDPERYVLMFPYVLKVQEQRQIDEMLQAGDWYAVLEDSNAEIAVTSRSIAGAERYSSRRKRARKGHR